MVLKPSELAPFSAVILAEILDAAGVPAGVFNLVNGDGPGVGAPLSSHPDVDMMSFTGSTRAGKLVMKAAADTVKKVALELGGKSANILLDDADFAKMVKVGVLTLLTNSGQNCNAPSRMLVPESRLAEVEEIAAATLARVVVGDPLADGTTMGPLANAAQFKRVQELIATGIAEGAKVVAGGPGRPEGIERGFYTRPTIFSRVTPEMTISREEIFGPVLSIISYKDEEDAIRIANDSIYGLSGYVSSADLGRARAVARRLRTGNVHLNGAQLDLAGPFGGYKQSGLGREWGAFGIEEFLEVKAIIGYGD
jgi:acyl-CoA reductase-like NAD-dependent aldehyde dehydrogenase